MHLAKIGINELRAPARTPRADIPDEGIEELAASIRRVGLINPLVVQEVDGGFEVVAGHRRLLAARRAGLATLPCLVRSARDAEASALQLHENLYRQELTPVEEAVWFGELLKDCGDDTDRLAALVHQSRNYVESRLLLLQGDPDVLTAVALKQIKLGVAAELNKMTRKEDRDYYLKWAIHEDISIAVARQWRVNAQGAAAAAAEAPASASSPAPPLPPAPDPFICYFCGQKEPVYDLRPHYIHESCRRMVEAQAERTGETPVPRAEG